MTLPLISGLQTETLVETLKLKRAPESRCRPPMKRVKSNLTPTFVACAQPWIDDIQSIKANPSFLWTRPGKQASLRVLSRSTRLIPTTTSHTVTVHLETPKKRCLFKHLSRLSCSNHAFLPPAYDACHWGFHGVFSVSTIQPHISTDEARNLLPIPLLCPPMRPSLCYLQAQLRHFANLQTSALSGHPPYPQSQFTTLAVAPA